MNNILIAVIVGGLLTLASGWLGPWLLQKQRDAAEWKKRRTKKYEARRLNVRASTVVA